ncbi:MAG: acyloxyacyl hydrolase [Ignavibacterium sp.]|nr:acyloxyacyl hydrolase [Ignavibacterium sp.]
MQFKALISNIVILLLVTLINLQAQNQRESGFSLALTHAAFDVLQQTQPSVEKRIELRKDISNNDFGQFAGIMFTGHGASHFYTGVYYNFYFYDIIVITPSFAPGLYFENNSKKLFYPIEFRSQIEVSVKLVGNTRVGFSFNHISNAGLGDENPGVESFAVTYIISL